MTIVNVSILTKESTIVNTFSSIIFDIVRAWHPGTTTIDPIACCAPVRADALDEAQAEVLAQSFAALADPIRLRLLSFITSSSGEVCACDLVEPSGRSQPTVSHHMKILVDAGLVDRETSAVSGSGIGRCPRVSTPCGPSSADTGSPTTNDRQLPDVVLWQHTDGSATMQSMNGQLFNRARKWSVLSGSLFGLLIGAVQRMAGSGGAGSTAWVATTVLGIVLSSWWVLEAARQRRLGVDLIALVALVGTLVVGEHLAGAVITVMLATGRSLEAWAAGRAERELHALMSRAPRTAHRYRDGDLTQVPLDEVLVGDLLLVQPGEVVPVDGAVRAGPAVIDDSALTGESVPVEYAVGETVRGGATNAGGPFDLLATTNAANSTYAGIVRLVQQASASTSPFVRTADRFALVFVAVTFAAAGGTWLVAGDLTRAVAVLVVATPCPLILAAPVAIVSGLSRAARRGVVVKGGAVLEALADSEILLFDKTGTVTTGRPTVADVITAPGDDSARVLQLAASLDQVSPHVLAAAIVQAARQRGLELSMPTDTEEVAGRGVRGLIDGHEVAVGNGPGHMWSGDEQWVVRARQRSEFDGALTVFVAIDGVAVAALILTDPIRADAAHTIRRLRRSGITPSGDGHRRPRRSGCNRRSHDRCRRRAGATEPRRQGRCCPPREPPGLDHHGRRRHQRRTGARRRRRRSRYGLSRRHRLVGDRRHRAHRGPTRPAG